MNVKRLRNAGAIAAGALLLSVVSPTAASAGNGLIAMDPGGRTMADYPMEYCNYLGQGGYGKMPNGHMLFCINSVFEDDKPVARTGPGKTVAVSGEVPSCPGMPQLAVVGSTESKSIGRDETVSWNTTVGINIMNTFTASAQNGQSVTLTSSASTGSTANAPVPSGHIGRMVFTPVMYYGEGWATMDQVLLDPKTMKWHHEKNGVSSFVKTAIPVARSVDVSDGVFHVVSRKMKPEEVFAFCNGDNPND